MSHPNTERDERVRQIRDERAALDRMDVSVNWLHQAYREHVDYLLSLIDSQEVEICLHCEKPIRRIGSAWLHVESKLVSCRRGKSQEHNGIYRAEPMTMEAIATRMRDRCVRELKNLIDAEQDKHPSAHVAVRRMALHDAITALQSLTLEGEQE